MHHAQALTDVSPLEGYRLWSRIFDHSPTPMQVLEQRFLQPLLPSCAGLDVLDLGCGTGRWLQPLSAEHPSTLTGIDSSPEMLDRAARKLGPRARVMLASCDALPLPRASADIALCSFALSHVEDIRLFAAEAARVLRTGATLFVTDLHPGTVSLFGWRRGFRLDGVHVDIRMKCRSLEEITSSLCDAGFRSALQLEIPFGAPEREVFQKAGKNDVFDSVRHYPAIYILQFTRRNSAPRTRRVARVRGALRAVTGARVAFGPSEAARVDLGVSTIRDRSLIASIGHARQLESSHPSALDLSGFLVFPGMINAHDHLEFALFPRLGAGNYRNYVEWATDIHHPAASPVREHVAVPKETRLIWGGIRNLLCGVTTVCHHNPYARAVFSRDFPVRVVRNFGWAHSLAFDRKVTGKHQGTSKGQPFILHLCEGVDEKSASEVFDLERLGALGSCTVLIHGLGLDARGMDLTESRGAALVWCPSSNIFLFGRTHTADSLRRLSRVALGSDSPLTAQGDLLDEIHLAHSEIGVPAEELYEQVMGRAARILRLAGGEGHLRVGSFADLFAVRDRGLLPAETLATTTWRDVELVVINGHVHLASQSMYEQLPPALARGLQLLFVEGEIRWIRAPIRQLLRATASVFGDCIRLGGRRVSDKHAG